MSAAGSCCSGSPRCRSSFKGTWGRRRPQSRMGMRTDPRKRSSCSPAAADGGCCSRSSSSSCACCACCACCCWCVAPESRSTSFRSRTQALTGSAADTKNFTGCLLFKKAYRFRSWSPLKPWAELTGTDVSMPLKHSTACTVPPWTPSSAAMSGDRGCIRLLTLLREICSMPPGLLDS